MNKRTFTLLICIIISIPTYSNSGLLPHKFYLSITDLFYNSDSKSLEITVKLFIDDLETALENQYGERVFIGSEKEIIIADSLIQEYVESHLKMKEHGKEMEIEYLGKETDINFTWIYLEVPRFRPNKTHQIKNTLLFESFQEQVNHINYNYLDQLVSGDIHKGSKTFDF